MIGWRLMPRPGQPEAAEHKWQSHRRRSHGPTEDRGTNPTDGSNKEDHVATRSPPDDCALGSIAGRLHVDSGMRRDVATPTTAAGSVDTTAATGATGDAVEIRWYCCLGTGEDPAQVPTEEQVVADFNASHPDIHLSLEIITYQAARDTLATQIAAGNGPDIVGPVGVGGAEAFHGQWLDLAPLIEETGYDLAQYGAGAVDFYNTGGEGQIGLPFATYPSMVWYKASNVRGGGVERATPFLR